MPAPQGWKRDFVDGLNADAPSLGASRFRVSLRCDGECVAKNWEKAVDEAVFAPLSKGVQRDEKVDGERLMVAADGDVTHLVLARWRAGGKSYAHCHVELDKIAAAALPAFERACRAMRFVD